MLNIKKYLTVDSRKRGSLDVIYPILEKFKIFIKKREGYKEDTLYIATAEITVNILYIILLYLNNKDSEYTLNYKNIIKHTTMNNIIKIMFSGNIDYKSILILKQYTEKITPNKGHLWVSNIIKEFITSEIKDKDNKK